MTGLNAHTVQYRLYVRTTTAWSRLEHINTLLHFLTLPSLPEPDSNRAWHGMAVHGMSQLLPVQMGPDSPHHLLFVV
jgi:hypothetical protein